jgi:hypothetical protein
VQEGGHECECQLRCEAAKCEKRKDLSLCHNLN